MTPTQLMASAPMPPGHEEEFRILYRLFLRYLADRIGTATTEEGFGLNEANQRWLNEANQKRFLEQCAQALDLKVEVRL